MVGGHGAAKTAVSPHAVMLSSPAQPSQDGPFDLSLVGSHGLAKAPPPPLTHHQRAHRPVGVGLVGHRARTRSDARRAAHLGWRE